MALARPFSVRVRRAEKPRGGPMITDYFGPLYRSGKQLIIFGQKTQPTHFAQFSVFAFSTNIFNFFRPHSFPPFKGSSPDRRCRRGAHMLQINSHEEGDRIFASRAKVAVRYGKFTCSALTGKKRAMRYFSGITGGAKWCPDLDG